MFEESVYDDSLVRGGPRDGAFPCASSSVTVVAGVPAGCDDDDAGAPLGVAEGCEVEPGVPMGVARTCPLLPTAGDAAPGLGRPRPRLLMPSLVVLPSLPLLSESEEESYDDAVELPLPRRLESEAFAAGPCFG